MPWKVRPLPFLLPSLPGPIFLAVDATTNSRGERDDNVEEGGGSNNDEKKEKDASSLLVTQ